MTIAWIIGGLALAVGYILGRADLLERARHALWWKLTFGKVDSGLEAVLLMAAFVVVHPRKALRVARRLAAD